MKWLTAAVTARLNTTSSQLNSFIVQKVRHFETLSGSVLSATGFQHNTKIEMGCWSSKRLIVPSISGGPVLPRDKSSGVKPHTQKAYAFPWLVKALTTPELNIEQSSLYHRRRVMNKGSSLDTSETLNHY